MGEEDVLKVEIRRKIYNYILKSPGLHERELARALDIPLSTLDYHLHYLEARDLIATSIEGGYTRYYIRGKSSIRDKKLLAILRQNVPRRILMYLLLHPRALHKTLCDHLGLTPSTVSFHLNKLVELNIITRDQIGRASIFYLNEAGYVSDGPK